MNELELAISAYRREPTQENHDALGLQQTLAWYRAQSLAALEAIWQR